MADEELLDRMLLSARSYSDFLDNIGCGIADKLPPRNPRLAFEEQCTML